MFGKKRGSNLTYEEIVSVMANAIGYVIEGGDGKADVEIDKDKVELYHKAACEAVNHVTMYGLMVNGYLPTNE
jgi:hypothetical protein